MGARMSKGNAPSKRCNSLASRISSLAGTPSIADARRRVEHSNFSIGLILSCTTVRITLLSKQCVTATTACSSEYSRGSDPLRLRASRRSNALFFSFFISSSLRRCFLDADKMFSCLFLTQLLPVLMVVDLMALPSPLCSTVLSKICGMSVKSTSPWPAVTADSPCLLVT